jgi:hypothetical protein
MAIPNVLGTELYQPRSKVHISDRTNQRGYSAAVDLGVVARRMYWGKDKYKRKGQRNMHRARCALNSIEGCDGRSGEVVGLIVLLHYYMNVELRLMRRLGDDSQLTATMNCSPARNVDQLFLQLSDDELEGSSCDALNEDLRVLRGRRVVRVQYLRGCQTWIDSGASA